MKSYEEMAKSALNRIKEGEKEEKGKKERRLRVGGAVCGCCLVAVLCVAAVKSGSFGVVTPDTASDVNVTTTGDRQTPGGTGADASHREEVANPAVSDEVKESGGAVSPTGGDAVKPSGGAAIKDDPVVPGGAPSGAEVSTEAREDLCRFIGLLTIDGMNYVQANVPCACGELFDKAARYGYYAVDSEQRLGERRLFVDGEMLYRDASGEDIYVAKLLDGTLIAFVADAPVTTAAQSVVPTVVPSSPAA